MYGGGGGGNAEQGRNKSKKNRMFLLLPVAVAGLGVLLVIVGAATGHWLAGSFDEDVMLKGKLASMTKGEAIYRILLRVPEEKKEATGRKLAGLPEEQVKERLKEPMKKKIKEDIKKGKESLYGLSNDVGDKYNNEKWCVKIENKLPTEEECGFLGPVTAMCVLGIVAAAAGIALALGHVALRKTALMPAAGGAACLLAGLFTLYGVIIFATKMAEQKEELKDIIPPGYERVLGWSFFVTAVGGVLFLAAGAMMLVIVLVCK